MREVIRLEHNNSKLLFGISFNISLTRSLETWYFTTLLRFMFWTKSLSRDKKWMTILARNRQINPKKYHNYILIPDLTVSIKVPCIRVFLQTYTTSLLPSGNVKRTVACYQLSCWVFCIIILTMIPFFTEIITIRPIKHEFCSTLFLRAQKSWNKTFLFIRDYPWLPFFSIFVRVTIVLTIWCQNSKTHTNKLKAQ